jgi:hypothetical protein
MWVSKPRQKTATLPRFLLWKKQLVAEMISDFTSLLSPFLLPLRKLHIWQVVQWREKLWGRTTLDSAGTIYCHFGQVIWFLWAWFLYLYNEYMMWKCVESSKHKTFKLTSTASYGQWCVKIEGKIGLSPMSLATTCRIGTSRD